MTGGKAYAGAVAAAIAAGTDAYGATITVGYQVFNPSAGGKIVDLGTATAPASDVSVGTSLDSTAQAEVALTAITNAIA